MADKRLRNLSAALPAVTDVIALDNATTGEAFKCTVAQLLALYTSASEEFETVAIAAGSHTQAFVGAPLAAIPKVICSGVSSEGEWLPLVPTNITVNGFDYNSPAAGSMTYHAKI